MLKHWIWLAHRPGVSDRVKVRLLQHFRDPEEIYYADKDSFSCIEGLSAEGAEALRERDLTLAEEILEACRNRKLQVHISSFLPMLPT